MYLDKFDFEPLDYDTSVGIDIIARNKTNNKISDCEFWYVELKYMLKQVEFNHSFQNIRRIICWDIDSGMKDGSKVSSCVGEERIFQKGTDKEKQNTYYLVPDSSDIRIKVISLKELLRDVLKIELQEQEK